MGLIVTIIAASSLTTPEIAQARSCRTVAKHWDGYVDVRSSPKNRFNNLIKMVPNGTEFDVISQEGNWLEVYMPDSDRVSGWVAADQTRRICFRDNRRPRNHREYDRDW
jgi:hypothetical protein